MTSLESALNSNLDRLTLLSSWPLCEVSISAVIRTKLADRSYYRSGILALCALRFERATFMTAHRATAVVLHLRWPCTARRELSGSLLGIPGRPRLIIVIVLYLHKDSFLFGQQPCRCYCTRLLICLSSTYHHANFPCLSHKKGVSQHTTTPNFLVVDTKRCNTDCNWTVDFQTREQRNSHSIVIALLLLRKNKI